MVQRASTQKNYFCSYHWLSTYPNIPVHISWWQQCLTFCAVCGVLFYYKRESTVVSSGVRDVTLMTHICSHSAECVYATFCNQTWYCGAPPWAGMSCEKIVFYLQGQGHRVGLYNCNGVEWSKDKTQAAESIKWRPQQAYGSNQFLLVQPQTVFSTPKIITLTHR